MENNEEKFMKRVTHIEIPTSSKVSLDLNDVRRDFGDNLNTLILINTDTATDVEVWANSEKIAFLTANNGSFSIDWRDGISYNDIQLENTSGAVVVSANAVKATVGRTGV